MKPLKPFIVLMDFLYFVEILVDPRFVLTHHKFLLSCFVSKYIIFIYFYYKCCIARFVV